MRSRNATKTIDSVNDAIKRVRVIIVRTSCTRTFLATGDLRLFPVGRCDGYDGYDCDRDDDVRARTSGGQTARGHNAQCPEKIRPISVSHTF